MSPVHPRQLIDELTADLEPVEAVALAAELARMIDLGLIELDGDPASGEQVRVAIVDDAPSAAA